jgi:translation initiation factor eIF-2B subunit beta
VTKARFQNINQLVEIIRSVGQKLIEAQPKGAPPPTTILSVVAANAFQTTAEHTVGNTVRRLLHHVREEYDNASKGEATTPANTFSIANFVLQGQPHRQVAAQKAESTLVLKEDDRTILTRLRAR